MKAPRLGLLLLLGGCASQQPRSSAVEFFPIPGERSLPFSEAVRVGDMLYLSGQLGTDSTGQLVPGGIGPETRQALSSIAAALTQVYVTFFRSHRPARSAFGTSGLALGARLELECMALISPPP